MNTKVLKSSMAIGAIFVLVGCGSTTENKMEKEREKAEESKYNNALKETERTRLDSVQYAIYRQESEVKLADNDRKIESLSNSIKAETKAIRITSQTALYDAKLKNTQLKGKLKDFQKGVKGDWESFKLGFNQDLDTLGQSISAMAEKNMKKK